MKYIRTKDGRILEEKTVEVLELEGVLYANKYYDDVYLHIILNQADTIEELCDVFVSITEDLIPEILVPKYISPKDTLTNAWKNRFEDEMCYKNVVIYGAIWTDKGLIYVVKMKGVLPNGEIDLELL